MSETNYDANGGRLRERLDNLKDEIASTKASTEASARDSRDTRETLIVVGERMKTMAETIRAMDERANKGRDEITARVETLQKSFETRNVLSDQAVRDISRNADDLRVRVAELARKVERAISWDSLGIIWKVVGGTGIIIAMISAIFSLLHNLKILP